MCCWTLVRSLPAFSICLHAPSRKLKRSRGRSESVLHWTGVVLCRQLVHDVAKTGAADLVIGQQPTVEDQGKNRVGGRRVLSILPRPEIHNLGLDVVFLRCRLGDFGRKFGDVRTLAGADDGQASAVSRDFLIPTLLERRVGRGTIELTNE